MTIIKARLNDQALSLSTSPVVASGGVEEDVVTFEFDSTWAEYVKKAVFYRDKSNVYHVDVGSDNTAVIPWEVLQYSGFMYFGVFGIKGNEIKTSTVVRYRVEPGAITSAAQLDPTPNSGDGLSKTEKNLILTLFKNAMYTGNMTDTVTALENLWSESGGGEEIVTYTITNTLSNVTSNNSATSATSGSAYSATLTANDGYTMNTVTVLMGGVDVTDSVYSNGAITIGSVTGNVSITATAIEASSAANWENGVAYTFTDLVENEYVDSATGEFKAYANYYRTGYVPCFGVAWLKFTDKNVYADVAFYNSSKAFISGNKLSNFNRKYVDVPANSAYFAISAENGVNWTVIPYAGIEATWEDGVPYTPTIIENSYVINSADNTFKDYNGWKRTDYLNCVGANTIESSISTQYFAFFDVNKEYVKGNRNDKTYTVPVGACYFIISETAANMASIVITPHA